MPHCLLKISGTFLLAWDNSVTVFWIITTKGAGLAALFVNSHRHIQILKPKHLSLFTLLDPNCYSACQGCKTQRSYLWSLGQAGLIEMLSYEEQMHAYFRNTLLLLLLLLLSIRLLCFKAKFTFPFHVVDLSCSFLTWSSSESKKSYLIDEAGQRSVFHSKKCNHWMQPPCFPLWFS